MTKLIKKQITTQINNFFKITDIPIGSLLIDVCDQSSIGNEITCKFVYLVDLEAPVEKEMYYIFMTSECSELNCDISDLKFIYKFGNKYLFENPYPCSIEYLKQMGDICE
jgi:hypothetical protein